MKNWTKLVWVKLGWLSMNQDAARLKSTLYDTPETRRWHRLHGPVVTKCAMSKCSTDLFCTPSSMWPIGDDPHHGHPLPRCIHSPVRMVCNQEKLTFIRIQYTYIAKYMQDKINRWTHFALSENRISPVAFPRSSSEWMFTDKMPTSPPLPALSADVEMNALTL